MEFKNSKTYSDPNSVANFDAAADRVEVMGDISQTLVRDRVMDFVIDTNSTFADTMYVALHNAAGNLLLEFYQDRDGIIRLKPPFWNEGVLRSHIIDPLMIVSAQEQTNWLNFYTRVITTGGTEEWVQNEAKVDFLTPVGVYVGNLADKSKGKWADYTSEGDIGSSFGGYIPKSGDDGRGGVVDAEAKGDIVEAARALIGVNYVYGGKDPNKDGGVDCSGFVQYVYQKCGYTQVTGDTNHLIKEVPGTLVTWDELQDGDICGFVNAGVLAPTDPNNSASVASLKSTRIDHVGICAVNESGTKTMIHAPGTGKTVVEVALNEARKKNFIVAKRII